MTVIVHLNGTIIGLHDDPLTLCKQLREKRRTGLLNKYTSIYYTDRFLALGAGNAKEQTWQQSVYIACDGGRCTRPVFICDEDGRPRLTEDDVKLIAQGDLDIESCVKKGLMEYLDVNESKNKVIALLPKDIDELQEQIKNSGDETILPHTHMEISPMCIMGVVSSLVPYPHHNQSPRNTYQCAMGKQAMGYLGYNTLESVYNKWYTLLYTQRPMAQSRTLRIVKFDHLGAGQVATLAVMSFSGYDIEDATIWNQASLDRGYGRCFQFATHKTNLDHQGVKEDRLAAPKHPRDLKQYLRKMHACLGQDGLANPGARLDPGSILMNKIKHNTGKLDGACKFRMKDPLEHGVYVDRVMLTFNPRKLGPRSENYKVKVITREHRRPEIGDKFSSRHGQKGVIGLIVPEEDLPFNQLGMRPDIIMNPHGFPSRMTIGKMIELIGGKAGLYHGRLCDATAFGGDRVEDISEILIENGWNYSGKDVLTSGITGETLQAYIFMGPVYYQKLKHMVRDKMHARSKGKVMPLTRQPTEGRSNGGGLRLGEMERDCLLGHGSAYLVHERFMTSSDAYTTHVCRTCGLMCMEHWCQYCKSDQLIAKVRMPYACKLLFQELLTMSIYPKLNLEPL